MRAIEKNSSFQLISHSAACITRRNFVSASAVFVSSAWLIGALGVSSVASGCTYTSSHVRLVTDMAGREVGVPETISRVFCTNPIGTVDIYGLNPDLLVGWNFVPSGDSRAYIDKRHLDLPSLGVWMGAGSQPNAEEIVRQNPDVLLCYWTADEVGVSMADTIAEETKLPVLLVDYDIRNVPAMYRFVGSLIDESGRAEELAAYCEDLLDRIQAIALHVDESTTARKRVFLAQGRDGLSTDPVGSMHVSDALELIAVDNVADMPGTVGQGMGMPTVNLEQLLGWNPDAVLVAEYSMSDAESSDIYGYILSDSRWQLVPCVGSGEVFRIPQAPFSWFGRPPSAVRLLGCLWLQKLLYPELASAVDLREETFRFYQMFYRINLDEDRYTRLVGSAGINPETGERL